MDAVVGMSGGSGRFEGGVDGVMSYKYVMTKHIDNCLEVSQKLFGETDPLRWVHGWGIMVALLERAAKPYLKGEKEEAQVDHKRYMKSKDPNVLASYFMELLDRFDTIVCVLHDEGVIHPRDVPTEDARSWFLNLVKADVKR